MLDSLRGAVDPLESRHESDPAAPTDLKTQIIRFFLTGVLSAVVDYGLLQLLMLTGMGYGPAKALSFVAGTLTAYALNRRWTFQAEPSRARFIATMCLYAVMFGVQWGLFMLLVPWFESMGWTMFWSTTVGYVIAQGVEAGGHVRGTLPLTELVPAVVEVADRAGVAVVAAGGIGTAADVRAALALGAHAVRIGTRFVATDESDAHERYVERLAAADADDTVLTEAFEVSWPNAPHRVLASCVAAAADAAPGPVAYVDEATGSTPLDRYGTRPPTRWTRGDIDAMAMYAGQGVGAVRGRVPVAALIAELMAELVGGAAT